MFGIIDGAEPVHCVNTYAVNRSCIARKSLHARISLPRRCALRFVRFSLQSSLNMRAKNWKAQKCNVRYFIKNGLIIRNKGVFSWLVNKRWTNRRSESKIFVSHIKKREKIVKSSSAKNFKLESEKLESLKVGLKLKFWIINEIENSSNHQDKKWT